jgi:hypothetical protein
VLDYAFGHMNNASYLTHAELARWEMLAYSGLLRRAAPASTHLVVAGTAVRYRREIRPFLCPFEVESFFAGVDGRHLWAIHNFRRRRRAGGHGPSKNDSAAAGGDNDSSAAASADGQERIRAQVIVPCVWVRKGKAIDPASFLLEAGVDDATVESLRRFGDGLGGLGSADEEPGLAEMAARYAALEGWMRGYASRRDGAGRAEGAGRPSP